MSPKQRTSACYGKIASSFPLLCAKAHEGHPGIIQIPASARRVRPPSRQLPTSASDAQGLHSRGPYHVGDRVLARRPQVLKGQSPWSKPLTVLKVFGNWTYQLPTIRRATWNLRRLFSTTMAPQHPL
ncbi:hypothetical protein PoB_002749000 [Plakobranchus ocellatus]|uniref:Uncharacterized protein n=1 Tax=Plakobranchus ocellatus TaxID=259542 RepID=A0AAV3ZYQ4_9GAST|nr:hypothetical protein PoB_002749000 [Plakobranchus ocellatus]